MRITICTGPILPVPAIAGGAVHRFWSQMAPAFAASNHDVRVFARAFNGQAAKEVHEGVSYYRSGGYDHTRSTLRNVWSSWRDARRLALQLPDADVLIANDIALPRVLAHRPNTGRLIVAMGRQPKGQLSWYPRIDGIAAASNSVLEAVRSQQPSRASITRVLPYAIDTRNFSPGSAREHGGKSILYAGRIHPEKGLDLLIQAVRQLKEQNADVTLTCIGPWLEHQGGAGAMYRDRLVNESIDLPVTWLDPEFDPEKLADIYRSHRVFVYPSLAEQGETFGVAPLEAMATGAVPVVSDLNCFRDFITKGQNGEVFDHTARGGANALAQAIGRAFDDVVSKSTAATMSAQAYGIDAVAQQWLDALSQWAAPR